MASCEPWKHKYDFDLSVDKLYRLLAQCIKIIVILAVDKHGTIPINPYYKEDHKLFFRQLMDIMSFFGWGPSEE